MNPSALVNFVRSMAQIFRFTCSDEPQWVKERQEVKEGWKAMGPNHCERAGNLLGYMMTRAAYMVIIVFLLIGAWLYVIDQSDQRAERYNQATMPAELRHHPIRSYDQRCAEDRTQCIDYQIEQEKREQQAKDYCATGDHLPGCAQ